MHRPAIVTLLGWLGILGGLAALALLGLSPFLPGLDSLQLNAANPIGIAFLLLGLVANVCLLGGHRWARIYLAIYFLINTALVLGLYQDLRINPALATLGRSGQLLSAGFSLLILCLLYSPAANNFFRPQKDPVPFGGYETVRQLLILAAIALLGFGGYVLWRAPHDANAASAATHPNAPKPLRIFENIQGARINARLIYFDGAQVILEREDGRRFHNPITIYSEKDQAYIRAESGH